MRRQLPVCTHSLIPFRSLVPSSPPHTRTPTPTPTPRHHGSKVAADGECCGNRVLRLDDRLTAPAKLAALAPAAVRLQKVAVAANRQRQKVLDPRGSPASPALPIAARRNQPSRGCVCIVQTSQCTVLGPGGVASSNSSTLTPPGSHSVPKGAGGAEDCAGCGGGGGGGGGAGHGGEVRRNARGAVGAARAERSCCVALDDSTHHIHTHTHPNTHVHTPNTHTHTRHTHHVRHTADTTRTAHSCARFVRERRPPPLDPLPGGLPDPGKTQPADGSDGGAAAAKHKVIALKVTARPRALHRASASTSRCVAVGLQLHSEPFSAAGLQLHGGRAGRSAATSRTRSASPT